MDAVLGTVALLACLAAIWLALLHARSSRRSAERLGEVMAELQLAGDELRRLAGAQERSEALAAVSEALPLGVIVGDDQGNVVSRNRAGAELLGTRPADALAAGAVADLLALAAAGGTETRPLELFGPPRRSLSLTGVPLGRGAAVIVEDVSERRRLDAVRRDFVANVSHELKTPVAALGLLAEALAAEEDLGVVRRLVDRMQDEAFRLNRIIDDLLDLSRIEGEADAGHEPVGVHAVVDEAVEHVRPAAERRGVRVLAPDVPRSWSVVGDRRQLASALRNLLDNAVKYSDDGSEVHLRARTDGTTVALEVQDGGLGIPSRDLERIFERFYRVDRGRSRDSGGTGLGLSIVRHVAANHGGDVHVQSVEGQGSIFTLVLPAQRRPMGLVTDVEQAG